MIPHIALLSVCLFVIAILYATVGHGGASGYLAILAFSNLSHSEIASTSLILNLFVAGISFAFFAQAKNFSWKLTWPFLVSAVPASFIGSVFRLPEDSYSVLLGLVLVLASVRLLWRADSVVETELPKIGIALVIGAGIGLISGMVGVGGGIFLSPVILFFKWGNPKTTATTSSIFIFANSLAGLGGRISAGTLEIANGLLGFILMCILGAILGGYVGSQKLPQVWIKSVLGIVLLSAAWKLLF